MLRIARWMSCALLMTTGAVHAAELPDSFHTIVDDEIQPFDAIAALPMPGGQVTGVVAYPPDPVRCPDTKCILLIRYDTNGVRLASRIKASALTSVTAAAVDGQGRIVVVGATQTPSPGGNRFAVLRFRADLSDDLSFGNAGRALVDFVVGVPNQDLPTAITIDGQNNIVVVGSVSRSAVNDIDFGIARLRGSDGALDASFGNAGRSIVYFDLGSVDHYDFPNAVAVGADGRIVVGGTANDSEFGGQRAVMARLRASGVLDSTFCATACNYNPYPAIHAGRRAYYFGSGGPGDDIVSAVDVASNGDIVIAGTRWTGGSAYAKAAIARFTAAGEELYEKLEAGTDNYARYKAVKFADAMGTRILAAGHSANPPNPLATGYFIVQAYSATLAFDTTYGHCLSGNSAICFTASGTLDHGVSTGKSLQLDAWGRPLFAGNYGHTPGVLFQRITNTNGPLP